jgi:hypothetical protein
VVEGAQHSDAGTKQRTSIFRSHDQRLYRGLPVRQSLLGLGVAFESG